MSSAHVSLTDIEGLLTRMSGVRTPHFPLVRCNRRATRGLRQTEKHSFSVALHRDSFCKFLNALLHLTRRKRKKSHAGDSDVTLRRGDRERTHEGLKTGSGRFARSKKPCLSLLCQLQAVCLTQISTGRSAARACSFPREHPASNSSCLSQIRAHTPEDLCLQTCLQSPSPMYRVQCVSDRWGEQMPR